MESTPSTPTTPPAVPLSRAQAVFRMRDAVAVLRKQREDRMAQTGEERAALERKIQQLMRQHESLVESRTEADARSTALGTAMVQEGETAARVPRFRRMTEGEIAAAREPLAARIAELTEQAGGVSGTIEETRGTLAVLLSGIEYELEAAKEHLATLEAPLDENDQEELDELELEALRSRYRELQRINADTMDQRCSIYYDLVPQVQESIREETVSRLNESRDRQKPVNARKRALMLLIRAVREDLGQYAPVSRTLDD